MMMCGKPGLMNALLGTSFEGGSAEADEKDDQGEIEVEGAKKDVGRNPRTLTACTRRNGSRCATSRASQLS